MRFLSESEIERKTCEYAEGLGFIPIKVGKNGWPDRAIALHDSKVLWIEFKVAGGKLRALQKARIFQLLTMGHYVAIINSLESGKALLDATPVSADWSKVGVISSLCRFAARPWTRKNVYYPEDL